MCMTKMIIWALFKKILNYSWGQNWMTVSKNRFCRGGAAWIWMPGVKKLMGTYWTLAVICTPGVKLSSHSPQGTYITHHFTVGPEKRPTSSLESPSHSAWRRVVEKIWICICNAMPCSPVHNTTTQCLEVKKSYNFKWSTIAFEAEGMREL